MLSIKFDNSTNCKIEGWLQNTIKSSKAAEQGAVIGDQEKKYLQLEDYKYFSPGVKIKVGGKSDNL